MRPPGRGRTVALAFVVPAVVVLVGYGSGSAPPPATATPSPAGPFAPGSTAPSSSGPGDPLISTGPTAPTAPGESTASAAPTAAGESTVWIPAGDHRVPGTLARPALVPGQRVPAVLLLHGDLSSRDENGDLFGRLAGVLAARGIASLRIDFAGSGDSEEPDLALSYPNMVGDATASLTYLSRDGALDPNRLAVLGLSRGGSIAATMAGTVPGVAALVSWSGAVSNGVDEDPDAHQEARDNGYVPLDLGNREFRLPLAWFDTVSASHPLDDVAGYTGPVLAVAGTADGVVPPGVSEEFIATVASADKTMHTIDGADHGFTDESEYGDEAISVTTDWLAARLHS